MTHYYFVGVLLPELQIGIAPEISFEECMVLLQDNLQSKDYALTQLLRRYYDLENFRLHWKEDPLESYGNLNGTELEEVLLTPELLPNYVQVFLEKYENTANRLRYFSELIGAYFHEEAALSKGFLKEHLIFERKLRLIQTALRSKYLNRDLLEELQFENPEESFIQLLITQKDAGKFELPAEFEQLSSIFEKYYSAPIELHKALCEFRFQRVADMIGDQVFTIDRILGYMIQLILVERWENLDQEKGNQLVDLYIKENA